MHFHVAYSLLIFLTLLTYIKSQCVDKKKFPPINDDKDFPKITTSSYRAIFEVSKRSPNELVKNAPTRFEENYDLRNGRYSIQLSLLGEKAMYLETDSTNQVYEYSPLINGKGYKCTIKDPKDDLTLMVGNQRISNQAKHAYYLQQFLNIKKEDFVGYYGKVKNDDRGFYGDRYEFCNNGSTRIIAYWRKPNYNVGNIPKSAKPLWFDVMYPDGTKMTINVFDFWEDEYSPQSFEGPRGVYCEGRKSSKSFPISYSDLGAFSFQAEEYDSNQNKIRWSKHWFDYNIGLSRIDFSDPVVSDFELKSQVLSHSSDLGFELNRVEGLCNPKPITEMKDIESVFLSVKSLNFKNKTNLFGPTENYKYIGKRYIRGIKTDVFQTLRKGYPVTSQKNLKSVVEMYFSTNDKSESVPVAMFIKPYEDNSKDDYTSMYYIYDWYNYPADESDISAFDLSLCYDVKQKKNFIVEMEFQIQGDIDEIAAALNTREFLSKARQNIADGASLYPESVSNVKVYIDGVKKTTLLGFTLLGQPKHFESDNDVLLSKWMALNRTLNEDMLEFVVKFNTNLMSISGVPGTLKSFIPDTHRRTTTRGPTTKVITTTAKVRATTTKVITKTKKPSTTPRISPTTMKKVTKSTKIPASRSTSTKHVTAKTKSTTTKNNIRSTTKILSPNGKPLKEKSRDKLFSGATLGGAAVGALLGGLVAGGIATFVQLKFLNGKFFGIKMI